MAHKILMIVGSLRKESFNRQMAEMAAAHLGTAAEVSFLSYGDLPYMDQDIEFPAPEAVARVRAEIEAADGLWIFTPEYNHSYPGVLKNLLDWLSRPYRANDFESGTAVLGKKVAISGVGGGRRTVGARDALTALLTFMKTEVLPESVGAAVNREAWASNELVLDEETAQSLRAQAEAFLNALA